MAFAVALPGGSVFGQGGANVTVVAQTGAALESIGRGVSINDFGDIAFMASTAKGHNVFAVDGGTGSRRALMNGVFVLKTEGEGSSQIFSEYVQINNRREVLAQRRMNAVVQVGGLFGTITNAPLTYIERWPWHGNRNNPGRIGLPNSLLVMGDGGAGSAWALTSFLNPVTGRVYPSPFDQAGGYAGVMPFCSMNNSGQGVFTGLRGGSDWFLSTRPAGFLGAGTFNGVARPQIADTGFFTLRVSAEVNSPIYWFSYDFGTFEQAVHEGNGFGVKGVPGVDDAGNLIVFCADLTVAGAEQLDASQPGLAPINPGHGLFYSRVIGGQRVFRRLAGVSGNGFLDPGESWDDSNTNGVVDPGEDQGLVGGFDFQSRACVNSIPTGFMAVQSGGVQSSSDRFLAAFVGRTPGGTAAVFTVEFPLLVSAPLTAPRMFLQAGDPVAGLSGTPTEFELYDAVNNAGVVACWARTSSGGHAVLAGRPRAAKHVHVLTHGFGNPSPIDLGIFSPSIGIPNFLDGWEVMRDQIEQLPLTGTLEQQRELEGKVLTYVSNWPSTDGWLQAVGAILMIPSAPGRSDELLAYAERQMHRASLQAQIGAQRIVDDLEAMRLLGGEDPPEIHLIGHSRGGAVNARVARLLHQKGITPAQYTALDGYSTDWPFPSNILGDLSIVSETTGIPGMRKVNVLVDDGFDELAIRILMDLHESFSGWLATNVFGLPAPQYSEATVAALKNFMSGWKAPVRDGFDNYVLSNCRAASGFSHHMTITEAFTYCDREPPGLRALLDSPLGEDLGYALPGSRMAKDGGLGAGGAVIEGLVRDGDFDELGALASVLASETIPEGMDPVLELQMMAMRRSDVVLSASWKIEGLVSLVESGEQGSYAVRLDEAAGGSAISQNIQLPSEAGSVAFDLDVLAADQGDTLEVFSGQARLASLPLGEFDQPAHLCLSLAGLENAITELRFQLSGGADGDPAAVLIDNIVLTSEPGSGDPVLEARIGAEGLVELTLTGAPGRTFQVQASSDLRDWVELESPMDFAGSAVIQDVPPAGTMRRYYRVAW